MSTSNAKLTSGTSTPDPEPLLMRSTVGFVEPPWKLYWERLAPAGPTAKPPVLMLPGGAHTGACYRVTPDGRPGWADRFVARGHTVWLTDWPGQGRCGYIPPEELSYQFVADAVAALVREIGDPRLVVFTHSMSGAVGWKLLELAGDLVAMVVGVGPGPPGNIQSVPCQPGEDQERIATAGEVLEERDDFARIRVRGNEFVTDLSRPATDIGDYLSKHAIGESTRFPEPHRSRWEASVTYCPPKLMAQRLNWRNSGLRIGDDADFSGKQVLIVTGASDVNHSRSADGETADFLAHVGASVDFLWLGDLGIWGNGHMLMLEDNSDAIADLIADEIERRVR